MVDSLQQHAAGAAGGVIDGLTLTRIENVNHESHDRAGGIELASLLVCQVGELFDQIFIRLSEDVRLRRMVAQVDAREMLDEVAQQGIREPILVRPLRVAEDAVERLWVALLDTPHGGLQRLADVGGNGAHVTPVAVFRDLETVVLREASVFLVSGGFLQRDLILLIMNIRNAFEEQ